MNVQNYFKGFFFELKEEAKDELDEKTKVATEESQSRIASLQAMLETEEQNLKATIAKYKDAYQAKVVKLNSRFGEEDASPVADNATPKREAASTIIHDQRKPT